MNSFQKDLYANLMNLVATNEAFYHQDFFVDGTKYRIFNYRLASYSDFLLPNALDCRGTMFEVDEHGVAIRLAALPQQKFFNLNENPMTIGLDATQIVAVEVKADGSLMSTYLHNGKVRLKSKGSTASEQCIAAMKWLDSLEDPWYKERLQLLTENGNTVNMEWCSPEHRIVLGYMEPRLTVLNARSTEDGSIVSRENLESAFYFKHIPIIERVVFGDGPTFVSSVKDMKDIEGFILIFDDGLHCKIKCDWYMSLHHTKDSITNPRRLFEAILDEAVDDLRAMFATDQLAMKLIDEMQVKVDHVYNGMVKMVEDFYEQNLALDRKSYALLAKDHFAGTLYFGLAMNKYVGKEFNYKEFLKNKWKELGLKDEKVINTEE